jgi:hypothetical protein
MSRSDWSGEVALAAYDDGFEAGVNAADRTPNKDGVDRVALNEIQEMLRDPQWGSGMLEDIAEIVNGTGRSTKNYPDDRSTWGRH